MASIPKLRACLLISIALLAPSARAPADDLPRLTVSVVPPSGKWQLVSLDVSGNDRRVLLEDDRELNFPAWSPDGRQLAFVSGKTGKSQIHRINADGSQRVVLTKTESEELHPSWTADGKRIVFASARSGNYDVWAIDADGSNAVNLTSKASYDSDPAASPDGKLIAFASNRAAGDALGPFHVWAIKPDGTEPTQIVARNLYGWIFPHWSPDATQILFSDRIDNGTWQLFVANVDGQAIEQLTDDSGSNTFASWSPEGRFIAYLHFDKPMNESPGCGRLMLYDTESVSHSPLGPEAMRCHGSWPAWRDTRSQHDRP